MSIKPLPEALRSSVRSGVILFDLTRVVEELIFNSLDAGATKVSVGVGVGTCYVKVVDNGVGITRDGLVLLGERYTTSKFDQHTDTDSSNGSFGFRGEALGSISDVSLLEIVTKAHGRPHGYRKVIKGCKCLYLGIDDDRQDVGTTVIARNLFYNQPVRRNHLQSSPKKVLHSVKECVLRIALVHLSVSFRVIDIESEDELLSTYPLDSPLPLLRSGFGMEVSNSLREIVVAKGDLKLSGYISGPCENFSVKAFQNFYINSRFICKCPVHKLLNQLAARISGSDLLKASTSQNRKRSRSQPYLTYILNLSCHQSQYDLTFEPSKTSVEFKDWDPILRFIEEAIQHFWSQNTSSGHLLGSRADIVENDDARKEDYNILSLEDDFLADFDIARKRCRTYHPQDTLDLPSPELKMLPELSKHLYVCRERRYSFLSPNRNLEIEFPCTKDYSLTPSTAAVDIENRERRYSFLSPNRNLEIEFPCTKDYSLTPSTAAVDIENSNQFWVPDSNVHYAVDQFMEKAVTIETPNEHGHSDFVELKQDDTDLEVDANMSCGLTMREFSTNCFKTFDNVAKCSRSSKKFSMQGCSFMRNMQSNRAPSVIDEGFEFHCDGFNTEMKWNDHDFKAGIVDVYTDNSSNELWAQEDIRMSTIKSLPLVGDSFADESGIQTYSVPQIQNFGNFFDEYVLEGCFKYDKYNKHNYLADNKTKHCSSSSSRDSSRCLGNICKGDSLEFDNILFTKCSDETDWFRLDLCNKRYGKVCGAPSNSDYMSSLTYVDEDGNQTTQARYRDRAYGFEKKQRRSNSAPPYYRGKKKFIALTNCSTMGTENFQLGFISDASAFQEISNLKNELKLCEGYHSSSKPGSVNCPLYNARKHVKRVADTSEIRNCDMLVEGHCLRSMGSQVLKSPETEDPLAYGKKWQNSSPKCTTQNESHEEEISILDVSSGILHLEGDSLVPKSISKNCLKNAKVLQQIDRKFIPVIASRILAIIDQHAADERIQLEELRHKVLSGELKTITNLDAEKELILPEMGYQLLQNYAEQVQNWGWICSTNDQNSRFKRDLKILHRQPSVTTLVAVPCILGVNLTDADLLEFLQQLSDTDGSSAIPPSVLRILNSKACRGAIMFGDRLLPSECSLIVEELKQTSLCFQCAHGRPTTVPLVNLDLLHKQILKLSLWSGSSSDESWHGLHRHQLTLERAAQRLRSAGGHC